MSPRTASLELEAPHGDPLCAPMKSVGDWPRPGRTRSGVAPVIHRGREPTIGRRAATSFASVGR